MGDKREEALMSLTLQVLDRLVGFETVSSQSNLALIAYVENFLKERGCYIQSLPSHGGQKAGLYAEIGPGMNSGMGPGIESDSGGILLSAHTDVVPVSGQTWTQKPFQLTRLGARFYGRGTTDMKGFIACMLYAADVASNTALKEPLKLVFSYDEEIGCVGMKAMIEPLSSVMGRPRVCIVGEPTDMQVAVGHKGKAAFRALCEGQAGHSAFAPHFVNALYVASDFVARLRGLQQWVKENGARDDHYAIPYSTLHVGKLTGGTALNLIPSTAELLFEYRHLAGDAVAAMESKLETAAAEVTQSHSSHQGAHAKITIQKYNTYPGLETEIPDATMALIQSLAGTETTIKVAFGTEAGFFANLGIPTIVCGPGSMEHQGHQPDEYVTLSQLVACENMMQAVVASIS